LGKTERLLIFRAKTPFLGNTWRIFMLRKNQLNA